MKHFKLYMALKFLLLFATASFAGISYIISWILTAPVWIIRSLVWLFDRLPRWWYYEVLTWNASIEYYRKKQKA